MRRPCGAFGLPLRDVKQGLIVLKNGRNALYSTLR